MTSGWLGNYAFMTRMKEGNALLSSVEGSVPLRLCLTKVEINPTCLLGRTSAPVFDPGPYFKTMHYKSSVNYQISDISVEEDTLHVSKCFYTTQRILFPWLSFILDHLLALPGAPDNGCFCHCSLLYRKKTNLKLEDKQFSCSSSKIFCVLFSFISTSLFITVRHGCFSRRKDRNYVTCSFKSKYFLR